MRDFHSELNQQLWNSALKKPSDLLKGYAKVEARRMQGRRSWLLSKLNNVP